jgi:hypothetical protein
MLEVLTVQMLIGFLGTTSVQLSERKGGLLFPKRHQTKHLRFFTFIVRDPSVGSSNLVSAFYAQNYEIRGSRFSQNNTRVKSKRMNSETSGSVQPMCRELGQTGIRLFPVGLGAMSLSMRGRPGTVEDTVKSLCFALTRVLADRISLIRHSWSVSPVAWRFSMHSTQLVRMA